MSNDCKDTRDMNLTAQRQLPKLLMLGIGAVGRAVWDTLAVWDRTLVEFECVLGLDKRVPSPEFEKTAPKGFRFKQFYITQDNISYMLDEVLCVREGDMLLDLLAGVDPVPILTGCAARGVRYLNAASEVWEGDNMDLISQVHLSVIDLQNKYNNTLGGTKQAGATAIIEHGMNPGMVNHFVLRALKEAAEASGLAWPCAENFTNQESGAVDKAGLMHAYAQVAYKLGLTSIHSTDCDYQLSKNYKHKDLVFASTWSVASFWEEASAAPEWHMGTQVEPSQVASQRAPGSSDTLLVPEFDKETGLVVYDSGRQAFRTWARSFSAPEGYYEGMMISHGENFTLGRNLTLWNQGAGGYQAWRQKVLGQSQEQGQEPLEAVWSPEVCFIYRPNNLMIEGMHLNGCGDVSLADLEPYIMQTQREQMEGHETVGVLLRFDAPHSVCKYKWSWCGNSLGYDNAALAHPVHCATVMQVVAAVVSGIKYMIQHPREGINFSEELAHSEFIQESSLQWLGRINMVHGTEPLDLPTRLTEPGALIKPDVFQVLSNATRAVRGEDWTPSAYDTSLFAPEKACGSCAAQAASQLEQGPAGFGQGR